MDDNKRIVEIGGVKLEVDLRHARVIENFKIGDTVKVLMKKYGDTYESHLGVIVGFDNFKERPTIVIAYVEDSYNEAGIKMLFLNKDSKDTEICPLTKDELVIDKTTIMSRFDVKIASKQKELDELNGHKTYFLEKFGLYFEAGKAIEKALS